METLIEEKEVSTQERILVFEDKDRIQNFKNEAQDLCTLLNRINELLPIETPYQIPGNPDEFIYDRVIKKDPLTKQMSERMKGFDFDDLVLSNEDYSLHQYLEQWQKTNREALNYIERNQSGFIVKESKLESLFDSNPKFRQFIQKKEQIERLEMCLEYIRWVEEVIKPHQMVKQKFNNPFTSWHQLFIDRRNLVFPFVNMPFVLIGEI